MTGRTFQCQHASTSCEFWVRGDHFICIPTGVRLARAPTSSSLLFSSHSRICSKIPPYSSLAVMKERLRIAVKSSAGLMDLS